MTIDRPLAAKFVFDDKVVRNDGAVLEFGGATWRGTAYRCALVAYRAKDREEYWALQALSRHWRGRPAGTDDDGLAPNEDKRRALSLLGAAPGGWAPVEGPMEIAFPAFAAPGAPVRILTAVRRGKPWPAALKPGEWRPLES